MFYKLNNRVIKKENLKDEIVEFLYVVFEGELNKDIIFNFLTFKYDLVEIQNQYYFKEIYIEFRYEDYYCLLENINNKYTVIINNKKSFGIALNYIRDLFRRCIE